jgi:hypothetical protein
MGMPVVALLAATTDSLQASGQGIVLAQARLVLEIDVGERLAVLVPEVKQASCSSIVNAHRISGLEIDHQLERS